jgi:hypothetical protein
MTLRDKEASRPDSVTTVLPRLAVATATRSAFPMSLIVLVVLFLALQSWIDHRDPKLALAPLQREPDLFFPPLRASAPRPPRRPSPRRSTAGG